MCSITSPLMYFLEECWRYRWTRFCRCCNLYVNLFSSWLNNPGNHQSNFFSKSQEMYPARESTNGITWPCSVRKVCVPFEAGRLIQKLAKWVAKSPNLTHYRWHLNQIYYWGLVDFLCAVVDHNSLCHETQFF